MSPTSMTWWLTTCVPEVGKCKECVKSPESVPRRSSKRVSAAESKKLCDDKILLVRFRQVMKKSFKNPKVAFDMLDKNGDNEVSKEEWMSTLMVVGEKVKWDKDTMIMMMIWGENFFDEMDTNGNGMLTFKEFRDNLMKKLDPCQGLSNLAHFKATMRQSFENPKDAFDMLDVNGDGSVSKEEWLKTLSSVGRSVDWDQHTLQLMEDFGAAFFDQLDTNLNGELSFKEFKYNLKTSLQY
mmetsp:Transcript_75561/g.161934  ORF Transcript_75561/g.161934 Transcript_75561/m.161934 type:complete len:239 (-) Transcript_75561:85-801(-)